MSSRSGYWRQRKLTVQHREQKQRESGPNHAPRANRASPSGHCSWFSFRCSSLGMTTPQQFLESFLQEKTAAWAEARPRLITVFTKYFGEPLSQHADRYMTRDAVRAVVEDVRQSNGVATAVARENFRTADIRTRYRLAAVGESWKIIGIDRECAFCHGTGRAASSPCQHCDGEGWHDTTA